MYSIPKDDWLGIMGILRMMGTHPFKKGECKECEHTSVRVFSDSAFSCIYLGFNSLVMA
jgi:hypothetical protein